MWQRKRRKGVKPAKDSTPGRTTGNGRAAADRAARMAPSADVAPSTSPAGAHAHAHAHTHGAPLASHARPSDLFRLGGHLRDLQVRGTRGQTAPIGALAWSTGDQHERARGGGARVC